MPPPTSLFAFEPADALVARRVPPDRGRDVAVRVSCDDALSTAFSCPAQTCLFRLHARLAAVARDETRAAGARRANRASFLDAFEALQASGASSGAFGGGGGADDEKTEVIDFHTRRASVDT